MSSDNKQPEQLPPEQVKIKEIADAIIKEGTSHSTYGNWISQYSRLGEDEQFAREHTDEIIVELVSREEVSDVWEDESGFDVNYYTNYVENYEPLDEDLEREEEERIRMSGEQTSEAEM